MLKFKKKPSVIEAIQFIDSPERLIDIQVFMDTSLFLNYKDKASPKLIITCDEGDREVSVGDWIIKTNDGNFFPLDRDVFEKNYEPIN